MANIHLDSVVGPGHRHAFSPRQRPRIHFMHHGHPICKATFLMLHGIGMWCPLQWYRQDYNNLFHRFMALERHYLATGLTIRRHGNTQRTPPNTLSLCDMRHIKTTQCKMSNLSNLFLKNFQGVRLIQNFIGQAQRESRLTKAVEHQEIPQIQL